MWSLKRVNGRRFIRQKSSGGPFHDIADSSLVSKMNASYLAYERFQASAGCVIVITLSEAPESLTPSL